MYHTSKWDQGAPVSCAMDNGVLRPWNKFVCKVAYVIINYIPGGDDFLSYRKPASCLDDGCTGGSDLYALIFSQSR